MKIQPFCLSEGYTNCYVASYGVDAYIIDAPDGIEDALEYINKEGLELRGILLTHGHYDHVLGLGKAREEYPNIPIYISKEDICFLEDGGKLNRDILSYFSGMDRELSLLKTLPCDYTIYSDKIWMLKVLKTPGHTMGSVCLYSEDKNILFSGDTLFEMSVGRTDLGGSYSEIQKSLESLKALNDSTIVFPGHGGFTTIGKEKKNNPYMR
jgi:glyoxylase-like metal-dependent hydrolase (beta-lactamase superfamily II)